MKLYGISSTDLEVIKAVVSILLKETVKYNSEIAELLCFVGNGHIWEEGTPKEVGVIYMHEIYFILLIELLGWEQKANWNSILHSHAFLKYVGVLKERGFSSCCRQEDGPKLHSAHTLNVPLGSWSCCRASLTSPVSAFPSLCATGTTKGTPGPVSMSACPPAVDGIYQRQRQPLAQAHSSLYLLTPTSCNLQTCLTAL